MHSRLALLLVGLAACAVSGAKYQYDITPYHNLFEPVKTGALTTRQAIDGLFAEPDHFMAEKVYALLLAIPENLPIGDYTVKDYKNLAILSKEKCSQNLVNPISNMCNKTQIDLLKKYCRYGSETFTRYCFPYV